MSRAPGEAATLADWLDYIDRVHPRQIELGLERSRQVLKRMRLAHLAPLVITVAGTNGKGSCVAGIAVGLRHSGYSTGVYTSPHIHQFNERIAINGNFATDAAICAALAEVDRCRGEVSLSYFEFATLAAFRLFKDAGLDAVVLEVGLGGRLDAVNLVATDIAVIASISIDHTAWLGGDRESIGFEKAGIARPGKPLVCGDRQLPHSITAYAAQIGARLYRLGSEFELRVEESSGRCHWRGQGADAAEVEIARCRLGNQIGDNLATILQALALVPVELTPGLLAELARLQIPGRFELRVDRGRGVPVLFDVAHNSAGAHCLSTRLREVRGENPSTGRVIAVFTVMADKDIDGMAAALQSVVDIWYIAQVDEPRCMPAQEAAQRLREQGVTVHPKHFASAGKAYQVACDAATGQDLIVVTGSFLAVAAIRQLTLAPDATKTAITSPID